MLHILRDIIWNKWRGTVLGALSILFIYSAIIEYRYPNIELPTMKDFLSAWEWWVWALIALALLFIFAVVSANQQRRLCESHSNWIDAYKARWGKLPALPNYLVPLVDNYFCGEPISKNIKVKSSLQYWHGLLEDSQERFLQLLDWLGIDRQGYLQHMRDTAPPNGKLKTKRSSFRF